ncbi:MAG TPA: hypothetical protein VNU68_35000 [Verrucomicrobiae bacterium]|nr:hypothetical protein [Verrucomicrobiae bacterium]
MTDTHRRHRLLDYDGQPIATTDIDIPSLPLIDRDALPGLPASMEGRLFNEPPLEPAVVLFHPAAEVYVLIRLTDLDNLVHYVDQVNGAVLQQAMGVPPEGDGYPV